MYLMWQDDRRGVTAAQRITEAAAAYRERHGAAPTVALVHPDEAAAVDGLTVYPVSFVRRSNVWVGMDAPPSARLAPEETPR